MKAIAGLAALFLGLSSASAGTNRDVIYQTAPIDALMAGVYDGVVTLSDLTLHGDIGVGTFNALDGEMICVDGAFYRVPDDGRVAPASGTNRTPFAVMTFYEPDLPLADIGAGSLVELVETLDRALATPNAFYVVRLDGAFAYVKVRSVPRQTRPYRPLAEAAKAQSVFELTDVAGTLVGFRSPPYARGINVPGWHFHFLSADHTAGGHVLDLRASALRGALDPSDALSLSLPRDADFNGARLDADRQNELRQVESGRK